MAGPSVILSCQPNPPACSNLQGSGKLFYKASVNPISMCMVFTPKSEVAKTFTAKCKKLPDYQWFE